MVAAAVIGSTVASTAVGAIGSSMAADAQEDAALAAGDAQAAATYASVNEQRRQYDQTRSDFAPYRDIGTNALHELAALYGIGTTSRADPAVASKIAALDKYIASNNAYVKNITNEDTLRTYAKQTAKAEADKARLIAQGRDAGTYRLSEEEMGAVRDRFQETPGYQFAFDEGVRALDRSASARGDLRGGGYGRELTRYGQGIANQEFNNYANRLAGLAGVGQSATTAGAQLGGQTSANISNSLMAGGQAQASALQSAGLARASGYAGMANAISGGINRLGSLGVYSAAGVI